MAFNPKEHISKIRKYSKKHNKWFEFDYMFVRDRVMWFLDDCPVSSEDGRGLIVCEPIADPSGKFVCMRCQITIDGDVIGVGYATILQGQGTLWEGRAFEKAETAAIGRALAHCGYGTEYADFDEDDNLADSPIPSEQPINENGREGRAIKNVYASNKMGVFKHPKKNTLYVKIADVAIQDYRAALLSVGIDWNDKWKAGEEVVLPKMVEVEYAIDSLNRKVFRGLSISEVQES